MSPDQANRLAFWDRSLRQGTILLKYTSGFVKPGKITFLMGPSGAGKTTLFNCLSGKATSGTFDGWFGVNGQVIPFDSLFWFSEVGLVPQFPIFPAHMTVEQYLFTSCRTVVRASVQAMANRVQDAMQLCGLGDIAARRCAVLSGGQTKKVAIARALLQDPSVLFLDEPLSGLDSSSAITICQVLRRLALKGRAICLVVHQPLPEVFAYADLLWLLLDGRTAYYGELNESLKTHLEEIEYRDPECKSRLGTLAEALNFVTLKPDTWDPISYSAAAALDFLDPRTCLHDSSGLPQQWVGTPAAWVLEQLLHRCRDHQLPARELRHAVCYTNEVLLQDQDSFRRLGPQPTDMFAGHPEGSPGPSRRDTAILQPEHADAAEAKAAVLERTLTSDPERVHGVMDESNVRSLSLERDATPAFLPGPTRLDPEFSRVPTLWDPGRYASEIMECGAPDACAADAPDACAADAPDGPAPGSRSSLSSRATTEWLNVGGTQFRRVPVLQCAAALFAQQEGWSLSPLFLVPWIAGGLFLGGVFPQLEYSEEDLREWVSVTSLVVNLATLFGNTTHADPYYAEKARLEQDLHKGFARQSAFMLQMWVRATASNTVNTTAMVAVWYWMVGLDADAFAFVKTAIGVVLVSHSWMWLNLLMYTVFGRPWGLMVPSIIQACLSVTYLFVHPDKTPGWLRWSYTVSPIRWGIQAVVMSGLDVVFALTGPFFQQAEALDLFYAAGLGSESAPFCLLVLTAWWLGCTLAVALVFQLRFRTSILKRAAILPDISPEPATCPAEDGAPRSPAPLRSPSSRQLDAMFSVHSVHSFRGGAPRAAPGDAEDPLQRLRARRDARTQAGARDAGSELRRRFDAVARGGAMDGSGFARFMREGLGHALPWPTAERLFRGLDVCGRGAVEFKELQRWVYVREHLSAAATAQIFCRVYDPEGTDRVSEELLVTGFQTVLVRPEAVTDLHWHVLRRKAREFLAFVDPARKGYFTIADLEAACRGNLTFLQYCATLC